MNSSAKLVGAETNGQVITVGAVKQLLVHSGYINSQMREREVIINGFSLELIIDPDFTGSSYQTFKLRPQPAMN